MGVIIVKQHGQSIFTTVRNFEMHGQLSDYV